MDASDKIQRIFHDILVLATRQVPWDRQQAASTSTSIALWPTWRSETAPGSPGQVQFLQEVRFIWRAMAQFSSRLGTCIGTILPVSRFSKPPKNSNNDVSRFGPISEAASPTLELNVLLARDAPASAVVLPLQPSEN